MTIDEYFGDWSKVVDLKEADRVIRKLSASPYVVCPSVTNIFKAFRLCPFYNLQVVFLGLDPYATLYCGKPKATGIAFANAAETPIEDYSPSLDVLRESVIDYTKPHGIITFDPSLEKWERQGVLLLNSALSCQAGKTGSHTLLWRPFIQSFLQRLSNYTAGVVYVLMGDTAVSFESDINRNSNYIIRCRHPSFYARTNSRMPSDIWKQIDSILIGQRGYSIEWFKEEKFSINQ